METELISSQLAIAYVTSGTLEWLKHKPWFPFMHAEAAKVNRIFSVIIAFFVAIGLHWVSDWQATNGVLTLTISGLTIPNLAHGLIAWIQQVAFQQGAYKMLVKEKP